MRMLRGFCFLLACVFITSIIFTLRNHIMPNIYQKFSLQDIHRQDTKQETAKLFTISETVKLVTTQETAKPVTTSETAKPVITSETAKPVTTSETAKPVITSETAKPVITSETAKPVITSETAKPVITSETAKPVTIGSTGHSVALHNDTYDHGFCNVSFSTQRMKSLVNNVTLYITPHVMKLGRLGNMMFRYACNLGIALKQGRQMFTEPGTDLGQTFKLSFEAVHIGAEKWTVIKEENLLAFDAKLINLPLQNMRIDGYLQSFCYFAEIIDKVRQEFTFRDDIAAAAAKLLRDMHINHNTSLLVGVHARRGDILEAAWRNLGLRVAEKTYFLKAFSLMKSKFPGRNITFIVSSEDLKWCRENLLGEDVIVMSPASPAVHLAVLSSCDHVIITGGTYGWWAGWLANGDVIYHTGFVQNGTAFGAMINRQQYYPPHWLGLEN